MAFSNVAVCLHGRSPGNETFEFEQGSNNHFFKAITVAVSAVSVESVFIQKQCDSQERVDSSHLTGLFDCRQTKSLAFHPDLQRLRTIQIDIFLLDSGYAGKC